MILKTIFDDLFVYVPKLNVFCKIIDKLILKL